MSRQVVTKGPGGCQQVCRVPRDSHTRDWRDSTAVDLDIGYGLAINCLYYVEVHISSVAVVTCVFMNNGPIPTVSGWLFQFSLEVPPPLMFPMTVTPLGRDQDYSLKNREPDGPASWFLDPGGWSKTAAVRLYFIFPGICTLSL
ncbi:hypothetical protein STEG23_018642, partial [Scotinomys teguina]